MQFFVNCWAVWERISQSIRLFIAIMEKIFFWAAMLLSI